MSIFFVKIIEKSWAISLIRYCRFLRLVVTIDIIWRCFILKLRFWVKGWLRNWNLGFQTKSKIGRLSSHCFVLYFHTFLAWHHALNHFQEVTLISAYNYLVPIKILIKHLAIFLNKYCLLTSLPLKFKTIFFLNH